MAAEAMGRSPHDLFAVMKVPAAGPVTPPDPAAWLEALIQQRRQVMDRAAHLHHLERCLHTPLTD